LAANRNPDRLERLEHLEHLERLEHLHLHQKNRREIWGYILAKRIYPLIFQS
jgi:hypothetical protein